MLANREAKGVVWVLEREAEYVSVMGELNLGPESKLDITIRILVHLLQNTTLSWDEKTIL